MDTQSADFAGWLERFEAGDSSASAELVDAFYDRLVRLARKRLAGVPPQVADDEGAVVSALRSFFSGIQDGQFQSIENQHDLWRVLATITTRKAIRQTRVHWKQSGEANRIDHKQELALLFTADATPEEEVILAEECQRCLALLDDDILRRIAWFRLEGRDTHEIAEHMDIHVRSVQRKLKLIEAKWLEAMS